MSSIVYHDKNPMFGMNSDDRVWPDDFDVIATVESDDLEMVYEATNSVHHPWWENDRVQCHKAGGARSTSVGDVVVNYQDVVFLVQPVGYKEIGKADEKITIHPEG